MNNLVWVFFSMAGISTPTPSQSALLDPSQTPAAIGKQERLDKPGVCARDMRAREVALWNYLRGLFDPYVQAPVPGTRCPRLTAITKAMA
jgi:hypothetical protein